MFAITWFDGCTDTYSAVAENLKSVQQIFFALKKKFESENPFENGWIKIIHVNGQIINPETWEYIQDITIDRFILKKK